MDWLKEIRVACAMTGEEVGVAAGITQQHYNFIENGKRRPSVEVAKRIAAVLGFEWTRFFEDGEDRRDGVIPPYQDEGRIAPAGRGLPRNDGEGAIRARAGRGA